MTTNFERFLQKEGFGMAKESKINCFEPWTRITVPNNGFVKTCCNPNPIQESIHKKTLEEIWYGKKFDKLRKKFYKGQLMKECCTHLNKRNPYYSIR